MSFYALAISGKKERGAIDFVKDLGARARPRAAFASSTACVVVDAS